MTRYPIEIRATTLVYLSESNRRRKDNGMTMSLYRILVNVETRPDVAGVNSRIKGLT